MDYQSGKYKFVDENGWITVFKDEEKWGTPQGDRFLRILLQDINKLESKINHISKLVKEDSGLKTEEVIREIKSIVK